MTRPSWTKRSQLAARFWEEGRSADCPIVDAHGHMGAWKGIYFPVPTPDDVVRRMDRAGVRRLVFSSHAALSSPDLLNGPSVEAVRAHPDRLRAYCLYHPCFTERSEADLASYDRLSDVYVGLKLHGETHGVAYADPRYAPAWRFADERALPVLAHTWGGSPRTGEGVVREIASRYPRVRLILGHSLHDAWQEAVKVAREFPQVYLDLCAVMDERTGVLERFVGELGSRRILFGTDIPWFDFHYYVAGVLAAEISEEDQRNILYRNAQELFGLS